MAESQEQESKQKPKKTTKKATRARVTTTSQRKKPAGGEKAAAEAELAAQAGIEVTTAASETADAEPAPPREKVSSPPESSRPLPSIDPPAPAPEPPILRETAFREDYQTTNHEFADDDTDFHAGLWPEEPPRRQEPTAKAAEEAPAREEFEPGRRDFTREDEYAEPAPDDAAKEPERDDRAAPEPLSGQSRPEAMPPGTESGENGERRRRRRRGRRGRGRGRDQEINGQPGAAQPGQPARPDNAGQAIAERAPRDQREQRGPHGQRDQAGPRDRQLQRGQRDQHGPHQQRDPRGQRGQQDQRERQQPPDLRGQRDQRERQQPPNQRERRDDRGPREQQDRRGQRDRRDHHGQRDLGDRRPEPQRPPEAGAEEQPEEVLALQGAGDRTMLINVAEGEECRIAIMHQGRLEELFMERASTGSHVGNIYKGRVTNVEPSIQAAFIDFGLPKNGFLHISDLQPQYFPDGMRQIEEVGRKTPRRERPPIQRCLRRGQEVLVQIIKEGIGTKGPTLTTYISIPGRFLVMLPGMNRLGVSRKIEDEELRREMRRILDELELPKDMGFILRTAGTDSAKRELQRDLQYLQRLWKVVANRIKNDHAPCELYQESDLVIRTVRDVFSADFGKIIVDDETIAEKIRDFLSIVMPRGTSPVEVYTGPEPLFHKYRIEEEIERINARHVPLPSGGSLVVDSTEALVAIDVNSGRFRDLEDAEETAYRINIEAAEEIARQLRLRDLGGLIVCDFIDMRMDKHRRAVERGLRDALKKHKERAKCLRMSQFGIIEMTRQRMRPSIKRSIYQDCPHCRGSGLVKNPESMTLDIMRLLRLTAHKDQVQIVEVRVAPTVAHQLLNRKRGAIVALEQSAGRRIIIRSDSNLGLDQYLFECMDARGGIVETIEPPVDAKAEPRSKRSALPPPEMREARETFEDVFD